MNKVKSEKSSLSHSRDEQELSLLMRKAQNGDGEAYKQLLTRIEKMLQSFVRKSVNADMAEDVIQEIILGIHSKRHTFNTEQFFLPWFYAIARYKVVDYIRLKKKQEVLLFDHGDFERVIDSDVSGIMDSITVDHLEGMFSELPEKQRDILKSVKIDGLSIKEAAEKMNLSESDIKINIHRALKRLRHLFREGPL